MVLRSDHDGLESLPLKLMIVAAVASLSIVPASEALDNMRIKDLLNRAELQLDSLISTAKLLATGGPGGARTVQLDFTSDCRLAFERIVIGDGKGGPNMSSIVLSFTNGAVMVKTCLDPSVWMRDGDGHELVIESACSEVRLSAQVDGSAMFILAEAV